VSPDCGTARTVGAGFPVSPFLSHHSYQFIFYGAIASPLAPALSISRHSANQQFHEQGALAINTDKVSLFLPLDANRLPDLFSAKLTDPTR
jgi:hypothetical protein